MTDETCSLRMHQASDSCASEQSSSLAMGFSRSTFSRLLSISFFSFRPCANHLSTQTPCMVSHAQVLTCRCPLLYYASTHRCTRLVPSISIMSVQMTR